MEPKSLKRSSSGWKSAFRLSPKPSEFDLQPRPSSTSPRIAKREINTLEHKYGRPSKMLSDEGAGGSILLVNRLRDNTTFAVKRFRQRQSIEDPSSYTRQIVAEHYVGACLHHPNIIKTLELFEEKGQWLQVMEYAPYCLFDRVMSHRMSTAEINCTFMQILAGANHLHRAGFAHRDLKLENVVSTENGIMKLIDFGSASICKEPGSRSAIGLVGCKPYMAPEVLMSRPYDPQKVDVWSLAIVYCCMVLSRFPWKSPDRSNEAFALFAAMDPKTPAQSGPPSRTSSTSSITVINVSIVDNIEEKTKVTEKVLGPWGLLRLLPSESRETIKAMLTINPSARPTLEQVMQMPWVAQTRCCSEDSDGKVHRAEGHRHHG